MSIDIKKLILFENNKIIISNYDNIIIIEDNKIAIDQYEIIGKDLKIIELDNFKIIIKGIIERISIKNEEI